VGTIHITFEAEVREATQAAFEKHRDHVLALVATAEIEHVGSTSVPGALTKGDVDLLVRVQADEFAAAVVAMGAHYAVHQPENWTPTLASFACDSPGDPPVGVQVVVAGSSDDALFGPFRDALIRDPGLLADYNALKRRYDGEDYQLYTEVKGEFVERVLHGLSRSPL
jgi:GrpB-like predicted nucleotidyltransferase (UPF0157 family)